jgi:hypothetical protein
MVTLQPPDYHVVNQQVWSSPSHVSNWSGTGVRSATATPTMSITSVAGGFFGTNELQIQVAGSNPLIWPTADIDAQLNMSVYGSSGLTIFQGSLQGDAFPDAEVFATNRATSYMLLTFGTSGGQDTGPYLYLPGMNTSPMGSFNVGVPF